MMEPSTLHYFVVFSSSLLLSSLLVPFLRKAAFRFDIIDRPNQTHKTHSQPVPYLGGFSIVIPTILLSLFGTLFIDGIENYMRLTILLFPSLLIAIVGFIDDFTNLPARTRFVVQFATSASISILLIQSGFSSQITNNFFLNLLISIVWIVGITNAFNLLDNLDGGAAGISIVTAISIFLLSFFSNQYLIAIFSICIAGAAVGFLFWNINPARIYLGDGGALFLGILFSILLLQYEPEVEGRITSAAVPIFIVAIPIIDTSLVVTSRVVRGISIFQGGRDHLSHRFQKLGFSRKNTAIILWSLSATFSGLGISINYLRGSAQISFVILGFLLMMFIFMFSIFIPHD